MRVPLHILAASLLLGAPSAQQPGDTPPPSPGAFATVVDAWIGSQDQDDAGRQRAVAAVLDAGAPALAWLGSRLRAVGAPVAAADRTSKATLLLGGDVVRGFLERQRATGMVYRGQYRPLAALQPFATGYLAWLLLQTPDWFPDTERIHLVPAFADLQQQPPAPEVLLGITDLIENTEIEPADLRLQLACLVWQWGRKEYVLARAKELRSASAAGDAEDRILAFRQLADLWYRAGDYGKACGTHAAMTTLADAADLQLSPTDWYWSACYCALSERVDAGLAALERCAELQSQPAMDSSRKLPRRLFEQDPEIARLRADPRFAAILARAFPGPDPQAKDR